jgi:hypothetical protein
LCRLSDAAVYEKEARMKIGYWFAILAFGALSTNAASAAHHHHYHHYTRGAAAHDSGHHVNASAKTAISTDTAPDKAPAADFGHPRGATPGAGPSGNEGAADTAIDTRFTEHHWRKTTKNAKQRWPTKTSKTTGAWHSGLKYQHVHNHHIEGSHRNAVGAVVDPNKKDYDKSDGHLHRNAVGALVDLNKKDHDKIDKTVEHGDATGPVTNDLDTKPVIDNAPVNKLGPGAVQNKDHASVATVLTLVKMNGQGIVGAGLNRGRAGAAALGGPAQIKININTGVLSGNMFHPKHP